RSAIPAGKLGPRLVSALHKFQKCIGWRFGLENVIIRQKKFTHFLVVVGSSGVYDFAIESWRRRSRITIESHSGHHGIAGPESCADHFMRIGLAIHRICAWTLGRTFA